MYFNVIVIFKLTIISEDFIHILVPFRLCHNLVCANETSKKGYIASIKIKTAIIIIKTDTLNYSIITFST